MVSSITRYPVSQGLQRLPSELLVVTEASRMMRLQLPSCRCASTNTARPIRLEKPAKFVPPSHGKRLKQQLPRHYGPELTQGQKTEQATKKYPHMMPPPGSFAFWFLTNRTLHMTISLGTLVILASITAYENWKRATPFREQLPAARDFLSYPIASCFQALDAFKMDVARRSAETAEKRKKNIEDVQKRSTYRRAHGLETEDSQGLGGWTAQSEKEVTGPTLKTDGPVRANFPDRGANALEGNVAVANDTDSNERAYADFEGRSRPIKKWFGIW